MDRIRSVADYQFGRGVGKKLFSANVEVAFSKRTGRIRYVYLGSCRLATMRPTDGLFSLSIAGAHRIVERAGSAKCFAVVRDDVSKFVAEGSDVFAAHVIQADDKIRAKDEVIVVGKDRKVLAVGRATLCGKEIMSFKRGVAVKVRHGCVEEG